MKLLTIFLTCLMALTLACPPPFNNPAFVGNSTHTTAELIEAAMFQPGLGWTDAVATYGNAGKPWPQNGNGIHTIYYCYANKASSDELTNVVNQALQLWLSRIGNPGQTNGHALYIMEAKVADHTPQPYCYLQAPHPYAGHWNPAFKDGTLVIVKTTRPVGVAAHAIEGYLLDGQPDRHFISIDHTTFSAADGPYLIAHEFGHVFGLWHEHSRTDRDDYLDFQSNNLYGYDETKQRVERDGRWTMDQVCQSGYLGFLFQFWSADWSKEEKQYLVGSNWELWNGPFDGNSIMLYSSDKGMNSGKDPRNIFQVPLVKWNNPGPNPPAGRTIHNCYTYIATRYVSPGDLAGIQYIYPWR